LLMFENMSLTTIKNLSSLSSTQFGLFGIALMVEKTFSPPRRGRFQGWPPPTGGRLCSTEHLESCRTA
jgi:hypothetical protein